MKKNNVRYIVQSASIASLYILLTFCAHVFSLDSGVVQIRISEALVALLYYTPAAVPGLVIGCFLSNIFLGCWILDIIFGTLATFIGAILGRLLKRHRYAVLIPNIISNTLIIPFVLKFVYNTEGMLWYFAITVGTGEIISCAIFGGILLKALQKRGHDILKIR